ncbi:putative diphthamide synthesis protein-domain-containing protein [Amylostereum chailletii]|nr:putative diphthamide synthesis protein-domain-containing protein [Amylostereum chailletii]
MAENTAFSSSGEDVISRPVQLDTTEIEPAQNLSPSEFLEYYEIKRTAQEIVAEEWTRIALQFPDELLHDSVPIYRQLKRRIGDGRELYVLADTSYGSCCADEVAAQHVDAHAIIHYGHACMSKTYRLPVIYVFGKKPIDVDDCVKTLTESVRTAEHTSKHAILRHDVAYTHRVDAIFHALQESLKLLDITVLHTSIPNRLEPTLLQPENPHSASSGTSPPSDPSNEFILYIGPQSLGLTNLLMTNSSSPVYRYDPTTSSASLESIRTNRLLMRRYAVVQKARDADVFGILVGTLGVASYLPLIKHLRRTLAAAHKKSYTISVGKLNPAKLANFIEIECFVLVACPENSMIEAKEFLRPIVTPYELQIALAPTPTWTGAYILDFEQLLSSSPGVKEETDEQNGDDDPHRPIFSLVTGKYRHARRYGEESTPEESEQGASSTDVILRQDGTVATLKDSAAGEFLQTRTFKGLEMRAGQDAPSVLEQGRSGIARGYADDH